MNVLVLLSVLSAAPDGGVPRPDVERLARAAHLWGDIRYLHPYLYSHAIDWDAALVQALPDIEAASSEAEERAALQKMLAPLGDPLTALLPSSPTTVQSISKREALDGGAPFEWVPPGILVVHFQVPGTYEEAHQQAQMLENELPKASGILFDMRGQAPAVQNVPDIGDALSEVAPQLPCRDLLTPTTRHVVHQGFHSEIPNQQSGDYFSGTQSRMAERIPGQSCTHPRPAAVLLDAHSWLPPALVAMQGVGDAFLVAQGTVGDPLVTDAATVPLGSGLVARVRTEEPDVPFHADVSLPAGAPAPKDAAYAAALQWLRHPRVRRVALPTPLPADVWHPDRDYPEMVAPTQPYRLLALFRFWNVIRFFYPYKDLLDEPWESVLRNFIPVFADAEGEEGYARALSGLAVRVNDGHVSIFGTPALRALRQSAALPIDVLDVTEGVAVSQLSPAAEAAGLRVGDVIASIDGEPLEERIRRIQTTVPAATPQGGRWLATRFALRGPQHAAAVLKLKDGREVRVERKERVYQPSPHAGPAVRKVGADVVYADLTLLEPGQVDELFATAHGSRALVLDMRGYPRGTGWAIASHIDSKGARVGALFRCPFLSGQLLDGDTDDAIAFRQKLPPSAPEPYRGRVVMLIDASAISQAEHAGVLFKAASAVTLVGTPTAGSNGDVTGGVLPGGVKYSFSGDDVRFADGKQLQRVGLQPDILVRPTAAGLKAGKDEVLERALGFIRDGK